MKRGPSIAKILDTRNLKALRLRFDVRAEHKHYQTLKDADNATWSKPPAVKPLVFNGRRTDDLPMFSDWMD